MGCVRKLKSTRHVDRQTGCEVMAILYIQDGLSAAILDFFLNSEVMYVQPFWYKARVWQTDRRTAEIAVAYTRYSMLSRVKTFLQTPDALTRLPLLTCTSSRQPIACVYSIQSMTEPQRQQQPGFHRQMMERLLSDSYVNKPMNDWIAEQTFKTTLIPTGDCSPLPTYTLRCS